MWHATKPFLLAAGATEVVLWCSAARWEDGAVVCSVPGVALTLDIGGFGKAGAVSSHLVPPRPEILQEGQKIQALLEPGLSDM